MFLGKNHGSHFITIKSAGKTHHPVPLRFAVNGSAYVRYASLPSTPATTKRRGGGARQNPAAPGGSNGIRARTRTCTCSCSARSAAIRVNGDIRCPKLRSAASPKAPRHRRDRLTQAEHGNNHLPFACAAERPWAKHLRSAFSDSEGMHSWTELFRGPFRADEGASFE